MSSENASSSARRSSVCYPTWWIVALREVRAEIKEQDELIEILKRGKFQFQCSQSFRDGMDKVLRIIEQAMESEEVG